MQLFPDGDPGFDLQRSLKILPGSDGYDPNVCVSEGSGEITINEQEKAESRGRRQQVLDDKGQNIKVYNGEEEYLHTASFPTTNDGR